MSRADFKALVKAAFPGGRPGPRTAMDSLWRAALELRSWIFAVAPDEPTKPLISRIHDVRWVFAFTDSAELERFLDENDLRTPGGEILFLEMPVADARKWIARGSADKVFDGLQFNYGGPGWFAPAGSLEAIHEHLFG